MDSKRLKRKRKQKEISNVTQTAKMRTRSSALHEKSNKILCEEQTVREKLLNNIGQRTSAEDSEVFKAFRLNSISKVDGKTLQSFSMLEERGWLIHLSKII